MDALSVLREDHIEVLAMLDRLERGPGNGRSVITPADQREFARIRWRARPS